VSLSIAGNEIRFDFAVLAASFDALPRILPETNAAEPLRESLEHFESSPITGIHLWFDRQISDLDHAVLLDRTIQWMFHKSKLLSPVRPSTPEPHTSHSREATQEYSPGRKPWVSGEDDPVLKGRKNGGDATSGSYVELVVSSSKSLVEKSRQDIIDLALKELREFFPGARNANLVKATVIKEIHATYSPKPGVDAYRPQNETAWPRVFLAGDWTATGWPATMEGAVRSGYRAAECIAKVFGLDDATFLQPDLPAAGFMRLFA
jgi:uncharacterized protein with NAD-binding domain and iron-sulfur cluster